MARFTLHVVASRDGFIAERPGQSPATWASPEEQAEFLASVEAADWCVMGRLTDEAAPRPERRRVVFSRSAPRPDWRGPTRLWLDPAALDPEEIAALVEPVRPMREALILGGTAVHDWFHARGRIDAVALVVEPVRFGGGLPIFGDQRARDALGAFEEKGWRALGSERLNSGGTRRVRLAPPEPVQKEETR